MTESTQNLSLAQARSLIDSYAFDLCGEDAQHLLQCWLDVYSANWIKMATIEALYLGRYKAVSIEQILKVWLRIGNPNAHFTYEFERLICRKLPKHLSNEASSTPEAEKNTTASNDRPINLDESVNGAIASSQQAASTEENESITLAQSKEDNSLSNSSSTKMQLISAFGFNYAPDWSRLDPENKEIHQFIPLPDVSSFFSKLKRFGAEQLEGQ